MKKLWRALSKNIVVAILALVGAALLAVCVWAGYREFFWAHEVAIAAGAPKTDAYILITALKTVMARQHPPVRIVLVSTSGTADSLDRLQRGAVQLAVSKSDAFTPPTARTVAVLWDDVFQLLVRDNSGPASAAASAPDAAAGSPRAPAAARTPPASGSPVITGFADLKGRPIGLDKTSGESPAFLFLAAQYKLTEADFTFVGGDAPGAAEAFLKNKADAVFRAGPLLNPEISALVAHQGAVFLPVENAVALHSRNPEYSVATIPKGTYSLSPSVPSADLPTMQVQRVLLSRQDADPDTIAAITKVLLTHRQELATAIIGPESHWVQPLMARIRQPGADTTLVVAPMHPGSSPDYEAKGGSFVASHTNFLALVFAISLFLAMLIAELRRHFAYVRRRRADAYNLKVAGLMEAAYKSDSTAGIATQLLDIFAAAVRDLERGKLSGEAFQSFHTIWKAAMDAAIPPQRSGGGGSPSSEPSEAAAKGAKWSLVKYLQLKPNP